MTTVTDRMVMNDKLLVYKNIVYIFYNKIFLICLYTL